MTAKHLAIYALFLFLPVAALDISICFTSSLLISGWLDPIAHILLGLVLSLPFATRSHQKWFWLVLGAFLSMAIDVDHAIAAGSFDIVKMVSLPGRPLTHSITFALTLSMTLMLINRRTAWLAFIVLTAHFLRDTSSGTTPLLWPLPWEPYAPLLYWATLPGLWWIAKRVARIQPF